MHVGSSEPALRVDEARAAARQWVMAEGRHTPGFIGAYYAGSITWQAGDAPFDPTSDVDITVVLDGPLPPNKLGKFRYQDVLLEVTYQPLDQVRSPDQVLRHYHLAGSFCRPNAILDPTGHLTRLQTAVAAGFAQRRWVEQRCTQAMHTIEERLHSIDAAAPLHTQVMAWVFAVGGVPHVPLVAGLRNPTVRRRYVAAHHLLADYGLLEFYPPMLELLGCAHLSPGQVAAHLPALADAFDAAAAVIQTPVFFASDLSEHARPIALDGSRQLIESGWHREAVFWMIVTYTRCQQVLFQDAPRALQDRFTPGYLALLADVGISDPADLTPRSAQVRSFLPRLQGMADTILAANPEIED